MTTKTTRAASTAATTAKGRKRKSATGRTRNVRGTDSGRFAKVLKDLDLIQEKLVHTKAKYQTAEQNKTARVNTLKGLVNG